MMQVAIALLMLACSSAAVAQSRFALLVGNQGYNAKVGALKNPHNDIALIGSALKSLGFKVTEIKDGDYRSIDAAINGHAAKARREGQGTISLVYYSGHGAADPETKTNYLIPVDVSDADDEELWQYSLNLNKIVERLREQAPEATHYVVFDACRNELNLTRKGKKALSDKGFVPIAYTPGVMIAYATAPGKTATDIGSAGGPYARALADEIVKPGVEALTMFRRVALRVNRELGQDPWMSASTLPEIYLAGKPADVVKPDVPVRVYPPAHSAATANGLFTEANARALQSIAEKHRLPPLPDFRIEIPDADVPAHLRRFVGIWYSPRGRTNMIIATRVHKDGKLDGYWIHGPPSPGSQFQYPANFFPFAGTITDDSLRYTSPAGTANYRLTLTADNRMAYSFWSKSGENWNDTFNPVWMLAEAERSVNRELGQDPRLSASTLPEIHLAGKTAEGATPALPVGIRPPTVSAAMAGGFFTEEHAKALQSTAQKYRLPTLPDFRIEIPDPDVPAQLRRFVGIWITEPGLLVRSNMLIATRVQKDGKWDGYWLYGPPAQDGKFKYPAGMFRVAGAITEGSLRFTSPNGNSTYRFTLTATNRMDYSFSSTTGEKSTKTFRSFWTLVDAERSAKR